jgi:hypothetical protein
MPRSQNALHLQIRQERRVAVLTFEFLRAEFPLDAEILTTWVSCRSTVRQGRTGSRERSTGAKYGHPG